MRKGSLFMIMLLALACRTNHSNVDTWDKVTLNSDYQRIEIQRKSGCFIRESWNLNEVAGPNGSWSYQKTDPKIDSFMVDQTYTNQVFALASEIVVAQKKQETHATCYAGNVDICVYTTKGKTCMDYHSVGNWPDATAETSELYQLLRQITTISTQ